MQRELLNWMPAWVFLILFILVMSCLTSIVFSLIKKFFPRTLHAQQNTFLYALMQVVGINYSVLLGFIVITLWNTFDDIKKVTDTEANYLSLMTVDSSMFPPPVQNDILNAIGEYIQDVVHDEWETMKWGRQSQQAFNSYSRLIKRTQAYAPQTEAEKSFYKHFVEDLRDAYKNRRLRIASLSSSLIPSLFSILIFNAVLILVLVSLTDNKKYHVHFFLTLSLGWILFFNIGLVLVFEYPFSTSLVSNEVFSEGFLARFKTEKK